RAPEVGGHRALRGAGPHRLYVVCGAVDDRGGGGGRAQRAADAGAGVAPLARGADGVRPQGAGEGGRVGGGGGGVRGDDVPRGDHVPHHGHGGGLGRGTHVPQNRGPHRPRPPVHPHQRNGGGVVGGPAHLHG